MLQRERGGAHPSCVVVSGDGDARWWRTPVSWAGHTRGGAKICCIKMCSVWKDFYRWGEQANWM